MVCCRGVLAGTWKVCFIPVIIPHTPACAIHQLHLYMEGKGLLHSNDSCYPPYALTHVTRFHLSQQDTDDYSTWETRYGLLLWLSMLSLVPFDIDTIDSGLGGVTPANGGGGGAGTSADGEAGGAKGIAAPVAAVGDRQADLVGTILALGMKHLGDAGPTRCALRGCSVV